MHMKEKSHSNVTFLITAVLIRGTWVHTLHQFIRWKSRSNVTFVITAVLKREKWIDMLQLFMKEWSHSNARFATTATQKSSWRREAIQMLNLQLQLLSKVPLKVYMLHVFMKERNRSNVTFGITVVLKRGTWIYNIHVASLHEIKKPFKCDICDYT